MKCALSNKGTYNNRYLNAYAADDFLLSIIIIIYNTGSHYILGR